ncbi:MAG TPA: DUF4278 domain-containing protein [Coleofasciculaceae cyanobacterium]|jgi:hypothetical protein
MKLIYRGQSYEYNPTSARTGNTGRPASSVQAQAPYRLTYRGTTFEVDPEALQEVTTLPTHYNLIYRGATYRVNRDAQGMTTIAPQVANAPKPVSIPAAMPNHYIGKVHQANLLENLQRRLQAAQSRGDQQLVALLEAERQQITA